ncbi:MAG: hypothetical protein VYC34_03495 [Planctomycetota bacterium]|nr:hypothetical protein [Planctomycetota bacterium]
MLHRVRIILVVLAAIAIATPGVVRLAHEAVAHGACEIPVVNVTEDACGHSHSDADGPEGSTESTPAPHHEDDECPQCHLLSNAGTALVVWAISSLALDAPKAAPTAPINEATPEGPQTRAWSARGPPKA